MKHVQEQESGGTSASIELLENFFNLGEVQDSVILCWIDYPGNSVALNASMLRFPNSLKKTEESNLAKVIHSIVPPFSYKWQQAASELPSLIVETKFDGVRVYDEILNSSPIINTHSTYFLPIIAGEKPPRVIFVTARADFQSAITLSVITENGTEIFPTQNIISNTDWGLFGMELPNMNGLPAFKPHESYTIKLRINLSPSKKLGFAGISISDYDLPINSLRGAGVTPLLNYPYTFIRLSSALDFYNPASALPVAPAYGVRYVASSGGNGWTTDNVYEWTTNDEWVEHVVTEGEIIRITNTNVDYVFNGNRWASDVPSHLILV